MNMSNIFDVSLTLPILLFFSAEIFAYDTYDSGTGELSIPLLQVGSTVYSDVVVTIGDLINIEENKIQIDPTNKVATGEIIKKELKLIFVIQF